MNICCIGAGYVGGPTMVVLASQCPEVRITIVDANIERINQWNSDQLPIFEPGLESLVQQTRGNNLFFTTELQPAIQSADIIFICVHTPTKTYGVGAGYAPDVQYVESCARTISELATRPVIIVEKSTVPVRTAKSLQRIFAASKNNQYFQVLSNPEFLAEGTAIQDLQNPDRVLIGHEPTPEGQKAAQVLVNLYRKWVPSERIVTADLWSSELSKLAANAFLAQRISSMNAISALCEATGADSSKIAQVIGMDSRIGSKFLKVSVGFGGSCFQKDILNLIYLCEHFELPEVADYWRQVVQMNNYQKSRFTKQILRTLFHTLSNKKITLLGFAFKSNTNDTRESPAIYVCRDLLLEHAHVAIYDPKVTSEAIFRELEQFEQTLPNDWRQRLQIYTNVYEATYQSHALAILTEWDAFRKLDFKLIYKDMQKPAFVFDGRDMMDLEQLDTIGFKVFGIGKGAYSRSKYAHT